MWLEKPATFVELGKHCNTSGKWPEQTATFVELGKNRNTLGGPEKKRNTSGTWLEPFATLRLNFQRKIVKFENCNPLVGPGSGERKTTLDQFRGNSCSPLLMLHWLTLEKLKPFWMTLKTWTHNATLVDKENTTPKFMEQSVSKTQHGPHSGPFQLFPSPKLFSKPH